MSVKDEEPEEAPMIRFGGEWVPAHDVWHKMETAQIVADAIDRFNTNFPNLSSSDTRSVVPAVRRRLKDIELRMPRKAAEPLDLGPIASQLLQTLTPEDAVHALRERHGVALDIAQLIPLAGEKAYADSLTREAEEYQLNRISYDQTAQLWNDSGRPTPGGGLWSAKKVEQLLLSKG